MSCEPTYGGGQSTCTVPTTPDPTTTILVTPKRHTDPLPFTGGDVVGGLICGLATIAGGAALIRSGRRKATV